MSKLIDLTGKKFGRLYVVKRIGSTKYHQPLWLCKCDCGNETILCGQAIRSGHTISCGCYNKEEVSKLHKKHGDFGTRLYTIWSHMIQRCYNPNDAKFKNYGARGIIVCEKWKNDYREFKEWAINNGYSNDLTIDRINVNGNYEPSNCRWVDNYVQENNRTNNRLFTIDGITHTVSEWARIYNKKPSLVIQRINIYGYSINDALTTPIKYQNQSKKG